MHKKDRHSELLSKYINNTCSKKEFEELMDLMNSSENFEDFDTVMRDYWNRSRNTSLPHEVNWNTIRQNIKTRLWLARKTKIKIRYATLTVLAFAALLGLLRSANQIKAPVVYYNQHTASAETKVVILNDGTRITLNANSNLRYPQTFNGKTREVYLTGEAYFQVVHNTKKPFIIHSGKLNTQVLGTSFTVSAYSSSMPMNVTVLTGKVAVKNTVSNALVFLTRGQSATNKKDNNSFILSTLKDPADAIAWIDNKLIFENADLQDVALKLSTKYGINIRITGNNLAQQHLTAIFQGQSLPNILNAITRLTHSRYTLAKNTYTIY